MPIETHDVPIEEETVLSFVQERTQPTYQFREAFRSYDASSQDAETLEFPVPEDDLDGHVVDIGEGSDFPRSELNYGEVSATREKYGFEVSITDETVQFGKIDAEMDAQEEMMRAATKNLDQRAFNLLYNNNNSTTVGMDGTDLNFTAVVEAYEVLNAAEYNPNQTAIFAGTDAIRDLSLDESFNRATDFGDQLVSSQGPEVFGEVYDVPVLRTNTGDLGEDEAIMVDMSKYGYLAEWEPMSATSYREDSNQQTVYQISGHNGFAITDADAAILLQGGV